MTNCYKMVLLLGVIVLLGACSKYNQPTYRPMDDIKKYGLLFRLPDYKKRVAYFADRGLTERAQAEQADLDRENRNTVQQFQKEFNFCPLRFYYTSQQADLLSGKPVLLNGSLQPDPSISLPEKLILANFDVGKIKENSNAFEWRAFQVVGTSIRIRPKYLTWWTGRSIRAADVRRINGVMYELD